MSRYSGAKGLRDRLERFSNPRLGVEILFNAGAHRVPSRGILPLLPEPISLNLEPSSSKHSIAAILAGLNEVALERVAMDVIREQRRHLEHAQTLYEKLSVLEAEAPLGDEIEDLRHDYRMALLKMRAHHQITSAVIDRLGRVPRLPEDETSH
ncbi:MAG: hypothetical protein CL535_06210 [Ahrensia sp.]|nr:hypothetical protein [Ahrensia sp.]|tara:strand:+ start:1355 stop:1813 length:459 start_codon:yes stop_codon:yes gene_type:complete